jgi:hypothetical protein
MKTVRVRDRRKTNWITPGIKNSSKKMRLLDKQKRTTTMKHTDVKYVELYKKIYKRVIQEAKRMENNDYINRATNKSKAAWQVINKERGKTSINNKNI